MMTYLADLTIRNTKQSLSDTTRHCAGGIFMIQTADEAWKLDARTVVGDTNQFGGPVRFLPDDPRRCEWRTLEPVSELSDNCRGVGPADMARCIRSGRDHLASGEMGCHVLDIIEQMMKSAESGTACEMRTQFPRQGLLEGVDELLRKGRVKLSQGTYLMTYF